MKLIAHRGNINGKCSEKENRPDYIDEAIIQGYDVEIDVWFSDDCLWLGHDNPQYKISTDWLDERKDKLWIHCKNFYALSELIMHPTLRVFFHETEDYTIIRNGLIWAHNLKEINDHCIIPLLSKEEVSKKPDVEVFGICSDYVGLL